MVSSHWLVIASVLWSPTGAREIVFPPIAAVQASSDWPQDSTSDSGDYSLEQRSEFVGLSTYANLPYVHCTSSGAVEGYDIAILGAPFDTATTGRPGTGGSGRMASATGRGASCRLFHGARTRTATPSTSGRVSSTAAVRR
jgi:agmatinase